MGFQEAVRHVLSNYATFSGRARRSEFWWFQLAYLLASFVAGMIDALIFGTGPDSAAIVAPILSLSLLLPSLAVWVRRLHDTDRTGWWLLLILVPFLGIIVLLVFAVLRGTDGPNRFGPDPLGGGGAGTGTAFAADVQDSSVPRVER